MKRTKVIAAVMGMAVMASGVLTAAPKEEGNIKKIRPKQTVTLDVFSQLANYSGIQTGWFADIMLEKFNVKLNIIPDVGGAYQTRMEAGNLGDIVVWGDNTQKYQDAIKKGLLADWEEDKLLQTWGPYINANMKMALQNNKFMVNKDKKLHGFGFGVSTSAKDIQQFMYTWDLRFDLYEQIGKPRIDDLYDMVDVLAKMKEICPKGDNGKTTYGVSLFNDWDGNMVMYVKALATAYFGYDEFGFGHFDSETGKYIECLKEGSPYLYCLKFLNKLNQKGLVDPDSLTQKYNGMSEDYQNGTAFWNIFNWMASGTYNSESHLNAGKGMFPVAPAKARAAVYGQSVYGGNRVWTIGSKTAYPELCMAILNWFCTPKGFLTCQYGPEGVIWEIKKGKSYLTEFGKKALADQNNTEMPAPYKGTYHDGSFQINNTTWTLDCKNPLTDGEVYNRYFWESEQVPAKTEIEKSWREWANASTPDKYMQSTNYYVIPGSLYASNSMPKDLELQNKQIMECIKNGSWNAIYAKTDAEYDSVVSKMISDAKSYGYDEVNKFYYKEAERRAAAEKAAMGKK